MIPRAVGMRRGTVLALAGLAALAIFVSMGARVAWQRRGTATQSTAAQWATAQAQRGPIVVQVTGTAPLQPVAIDQVRPETTGTVAAIHVAEGGAVRAGQTVITLRNDQAQPLLDQARTEYELALSRLAQFLRPPAAEIAAAEIRLRLAQQTLARRLDDLDRLRVTAPLAGVVLALPVAPGEEVAAGALIAIVGDNSAFTVTVSVPEGDLSRVVPGQEATVTVGALGVTGTGTVTAVAGEATASGKSAVFPVTVRVPGSLLPGARGGMAATVNITNGPAGLAGSLAYAARRELRAPGTATVTEVHYQAGDQVEKGALIARLDSPTLETQADQARLDAENAAAALARLRDPAANDPDTAAQLRLKVSQAQVTLDSRAADVARLKVAAPYSGVVTSLLVRVGDRVNTNTNLFTIADYSRMKLVLTVDELDVTKLRPGQAAGVQVDAVGARTYEGRVTRIAPVGVSREGVANFDVTIEIPEPSGLLPAMTATATVEVARKDSALLVPFEAVERRGGRAVVYVLADGRPQARPVQLGLFTDTVIEIVQGLVPGETVITGSLNAQGGGSLSDLFRRGGGARPGGPGRRPPRPPGGGG